MALAGSLIGAFGVAQQAEAGGDPVARYCGPWGTYVEFTATAKWPTHGHVFEKSVHVHADKNTAEKIEGVTYKVRKPNGETEEIAGEGPNFEATIKDGSPEIMAEVRYEGGAKFDARFDMWPVPPRSCF